MYKHLLSFEDSKKNATEWGKNTKLYSEMAGAHGCECIWTAQKKNLTQLQTYLAPKERHCFYCPL